MQNLHMKLLCCKWPNQYYFIYPAYILYVFIIFMIYFLNYGKSVLSMIYSSCYLRFRLDLLHITIIFELKNWLDWWFKKIYLWFTVSTISELIIDFNPINGEQAENAMIEMLENNHHIETLSCTLCSFNQTFCKFFFLSPASFL